MTNIYYNIKKAYKRNFSLKGRLTRREYFSFFLPYILFPIFIAFINVMSMSSNAKTAISHLLFAVTIVGIIPLFITTIKRLRDAGYTPWFILLAAIPYVGTLILLYLLCKPTSNR